jgi:hypothetical protein
LYALRQVRYKANSDWVGDSEEQEGNFRRDGVNREGGLRRSGDNDIGVKRHKLGHECGDAVELVLGGANLDLKVASHVVSPCAQRIGERPYRRVLHTLYNAYSMHPLLCYSFMCKRGQTSRNNGEHTKRSRRGRQIGHEFPVVHAHLRLKTHALGEKA